MKHIKKLAKLENRKNVYESLMRVLNADAAKMYKKPGSLKK